MAPRKTKARLPLHQIIFFSVGHVLSDLFNAIYSSYLLTFQTKILELPSNIVGLLWFIPAGIDAPLALLIGYVSDNFSVPFLSKFYGRRKSWHLIGCSLVGLFMPFTLMPCFLCGDRNNGWMVVMYFIFLMVCANAGWSLTQANFLALIPEIAKRQSEMVKLGAISSAMTLICGIYVYVVTWVLLGSDTSDTLSFNQWKEFMNLVIIVVATGAFFAIVFHIGTREPNSKKGQIKKKPRSSHESHDKKLHAFTAESYEGPQPTLPTQVDLYQTAHARSVSDVIQGEVSTAIVNASFEKEEEEDEDKESSKYDKSHGESKNDLRLSVLELENHLWQALSENNDSAKEKYETDSVESSGYEGDSSLEGTDVESVELCMPETFMDMVPNHSTLILNSIRGSTRVSPLPSPRLSRSESKRFPRSSLVSEEIHIHPHGQGVDYGIHRKVRSRINSESLESPFSTPTLSRSASNRLSISPLAIEEPHVLYLSGIDPKIRSRMNSETQESTCHSPSSRNYKNLPLGLQIDSSSNSLDLNYKDTLGETHLNSVIRNDGETEKETSKNGTNDVNSVGENCDLTIIDRSKCKNTGRTKSWKTLFKNPLFYKLGAAYMFTRISQNIINSYLPLYLMDHLKFEKASIAYFPLVILISGVFASIAAKKLNKLLGNKWTFVLGSVAVMGASGWFYLLTAETRSFAYIPAIISGSGTSIMFVTSLALAAEFVNADRSSGAFLMASMGFFAKVGLGSLFGFLQELAPEKTSSDCPECTEYVRYVFSLTPGVSAILGLVAFILFIPATIQCRPIAETVDAETQTDAFPFNELFTNTLEIINEDDESVETKEQRTVDKKISGIEVNQITTEAETLDTRL